MKGEMVFIVGIKLLGSGEVIHGDFRNAHRNAAAAQPATGGDAGSPGQVTLPEDLPLCVLERKSSR